MAAGLVPRIIVLALGAGALGFPDALRVLLDVAGRSPLTDMAICILAMAVVTAQVLGAMLLARFVRKAARAGGVAHAHGLAPPRTDRFAALTLVVSIAVAFLVSACLLVASGAGAGFLGLFHLVVADVARKPVIVALATAAVAVPCARPLLRVFREEDHSQSHGAAAAPASGSAGTGRLASMTQAANFTGAAAFLLAVSGGLYAQRGSLVVLAAVVGALLLARFTFTRRALNAAGAGGRAAPPPTADTRRFCGKLTRLAPYLGAASFAVTCLVLTSLTAPRTHDCLIEVCVLRVRAGADPEPEGGCRCS